MRKYFLSELYGRIGQILQEHGDMEIVREKILGIDTWDNQSLNLVRLSRESFDTFILKDMDGRFEIKKFVIDILK